MRSSRPSRVHQTGAPIGAWGKPLVCSITCSTVMTSLPWLANSGMKSATFLAGIELALADELPHRAGHEDLGRREDHEAGLVVGVADGLEGGELAVLGHGDLGGREQAGVDLSREPLQQRIKSFGDDAEGRGVCDDGCAHGSDANQRMLSVAPGAVVCRC